MAIRRKICEEEIQGEVNEKKRARILEDDRLSKLPDDLKLHILSFLDSPDAIQTTMLSKTWVSFWSRIPVLEFYFFEEYNDSVYVNFFSWFLRVTRSAQLTFTRRLGRGTDMLLKNVFEYAFWHGVKKLDTDIDTSTNRTWPVCLNSSFESLIMNGSFESLTSLELQNEISSITWPFLPRSGSFENLIALNMKGAIITDPDPFSGIPLLERLTLVICDIRTEGKTLHVHALNLSELSIRYQNFHCCELTTPRLRFFELRFFNSRGCEFPLFRNHNNKGLPVLDTMVISCSTRPPHEKKLFDNLFSLFCTFGNVKSLTLFRSTVEVLSSFRGELVKRNSPLQNLKCLKLVIWYDFNGWFSSSKIFADVKAYLLQNSPHAEVTMLL